jgi:hypothetical protein
MSGSNSSPPAADPDAVRSRPAPDPLALTVYDLPDLGPDGAAGASSTRAGRVKMLLILLVCAAPVIASYLTYYVIRPEVRRNYGELIEPMRPVPEVVGIDPQGQSVPLPALRQQWLLVSVADSACDETCERHLYLQRQLREGLGKDKDRLDWVWLRTGSRELSDTLRRATAAATVLWVEPQALSDWLQPAAGRTLSDHLYVVDPMGNWMMRFPAQADPTRVRRDLEVLMKASNAWDKAGREQ